MKRFILIGFLLSFFLPSIVFAGDKAPTKTEEVARLELQLIQTTIDKLTAQVQLLRIEKMKAQKTLMGIINEKAELKKEEKKVESTNER